MKICVLVFISFLQFIHKYIFVCWNWIVSLALNVTDKKLINILENMIYFYTTNIILYRETQIYEQLIM